jgi:hypothetical protein
MCHITIQATWVFSSAPTFEDEYAIGADLMTSEGAVLAGCLWSGGNLDITSDGCGVLDSGKVLGLRSDNIPWPTEEEARHGYLSR